MNAADVYSGFIQFCLRKIVFQIFRIDYLCGYKYPPPVFGYGFQQVRLVLSFKPHAVPVCTSTGFLCAMEQLFFNFFKCFHMMFF